MENLQNIIGFCAGVMGVCVMLPQLYKSYKTKSLGDISWGMLILFSVNCLLWLVYGILLDSNPLVLNNSLCLLIGLCQIFLKVKYNKN